MSIVEYNNCVLSRKYMNVNVSLCGGDGMKLDDMVGMRSGDGDLMRGMEWGFKQWWWDGNKVMEMACRWGQNCLPRHSLQRHSPTDLSQLSKVDKLSSTYMYQQATSRWPNSKILVSTWCIKWPQLSRCVVNVTIVGLAVFNLTDASQV